MKTEKSAVSHHNPYRRKDSKRKMSLMIIVKITAIVAATDTLLILAGKKNLINVPNICYVPTLLLSFTSIISFNHHPILTW